MKSFLKDVRIEDIEIYLEKAEAHIREAHEAIAAGESADIVLAQRILGVFLEVAKTWEGLGPAQQRLMCAAVRYFSRSFDEISDFESEIGFDDDLEVLNACLLALDREDLLLQG